MFQKGGMAKAYDPSKVEERIYAFWEGRGYFAPRDDGKSPFTIVIPPPNISGELHHGHAMFVTFEDLMIRWHRMLGEPTLWLPGTDHAGIVTQVVVERELAKEGLTRHDLGRERFEQRVWQWKEKYGGHITQQIRRLGASCDWSRERFTLDKGLSRAVREAFVHLYRKELIYRGPYLINWCPRCETALSDLEVEHQEEPAKLYRVRYPLVGGGYIQVATTRPETILGDTAVAVNPADERYRDMVERIAILPAIGRKIPIIADSVVKMDFGTGAVKVTPGHDPNDYEIGQRHNLPIVNVMRQDGRMNENTGKYAGMDRYECREALLSDLKKEGLLVGIDEDYSHAIGRCYRCEAVVEPLISEQWFVRMRPLAEPAIEVVKDGHIRIIPERFEQDYYHWMENIRDWCISRQLWWGHRIPVWYCAGCEGLIVETETPTQCPNCGSKALHQDPDVLDTWFSSGLWPFSTLGWPEDTEDLRRFYPTSVMGTAYDILFFWVARMIMLGLEFMGEIPFHTVYLHGLMRDDQGEKISKSKGNAPDVLDIVRDYGADALRFTIVSGSTPGKDMKLYEEKLIASRNFANKIWSAARFVITNLDPKKPPIPPEDRGFLSLADRWILSRLDRLIGEVTRLMEEYQFGEAAREIYDFLWGEYCDWYIEISKLSLYKGDEEAKRRVLGVLVEVLEHALRLLHPLMPFITEELWQRVPHQGESLIVAPWPEPGQRDLAAEGEMELIMEMVRAIRNARSEYKVEPSHYIEGIIVADERRDLILSQAEIISALARIAPEKLTIASSLEKAPAKALALAIRDVEIYLPLREMVDLEREKMRLTEELEEVEREIARSQKLLSNQSFLSKAPAAVVEREREKLAQHLGRRSGLEVQLERLS